MICKCIQLPVRKQFLILWQVCTSWSSYLVDCTCWFICYLGITAQAVSTKQVYGLGIPKLSCISTKLPLYDSNPLLECMYSEIVNVYGMLREFLMRSRYLWLVLIDKYVISLSFFFCTNNTLKECTSRISCNLVKYFHGLIKFSF